jgi:cyclic lactone autoinducer peptide
MLALLGEFIARTASGACYYMWLDEEEMPESLL